MSGQACGTEIPWDLAHNFTEGDATGAAPQSWKKGKMRHFEFVPRN